jgi:hypothetical protein
LHDPKFEADEKIGTGFCNFVRDKVTVIINFVFVTTEYAMNVFRTGVTFVRHKSFTYVVPISIGTSFVSAAKSLHPQNENSETENAKLLLPEKENNTPDQTALHLLALLQ